jgi:hypothetical protein
MLIVAVTEIPLGTSGVDTSICKIIAAGVSQHMRMNVEIRLIVTEVQLLIVQLESS